MKKILGACIGDCVHIAGIHRFLQLAEKLDYETVFLGPAIDIEQIIDAIKKYNPDIVGFIYRLTPDAGINVLRDLKSNNGTYVRGEKIQRYNLNNNDEFFLGKHS